MTEWLPIETAPKDGTKVLLHCDKFVPIVCEWHGGSWRNIWGEFESTWPSKWKPTHWMPLPPSPQKPLDDEGCPRLFGRPW